MARRPGIRLRSRVGLVAVVVLGLGFVAAACVPAAEPEPEPEPEPTTTTAPPPTVYEAACAGTLVPSTPGSVASSAVDELSGIAASRRNGGVWWVHNDSGNPASVYAIGDDGRDLGTYSLSGATNVDWEDIAVGPGPVSGTQYLYVGDIGDPGGANPQRADISVARVAEPAVDPATAGPGTVTLSGVERLTFTFPTGARSDAETLFVDPTTGELYIVTKDWSLAGGGRVYRAPANLPAGSVTALQEVATVSVGALQAVTGGDVTPSGEFVALRTDSPFGNGTVVLYRRPSGGSIVDAFGGASCAGATGDESQGEAIGFTPDGRGYVTASEGAHPPLHRFQAP